MAKKKPTSKDVARLAGVSQPTVSMILNNYDNVRFSPETIQRVMDARTKLNYRIPSSRKGGGGDLWPASAVRVKFVPKLVVRASTWPNRRKKQSNSP